VRRNVPTYDPRDQRSSGKNLGLHFIYFSLLLIFGLLVALVYEDLSVTRSEVETLQVRLETQLQKVSEIGDDLSDSVSKQAYDKLNDAMVLAVLQVDELKRKLEQARGLNESRSNGDAELRANLDKLRANLDKRNATIRELKTEIANLQEAAGVQSLPIAQSQNEGSVSASNRDGDIAEDLVATQSSYTEAQLRVRVSPVYPRRALSRGREGNCKLGFFVLPTGKPEVNDISCSPSGIGFERSSSQALESFKYSPALLDGVPVRSEAKTVTFSFDLD
jgi:hypothetical protein